MGIIIKGNLVRKKHREKIKIALDGKEVYGYKEEKNWEPDRVVEYFPVTNFKVKERMVENGKKEEWETEILGWGRFDQTLKTSFQLHNRSKTGRILLRGGDKKLWRVKIMNQEKGVWQDKEKGIPKPPKIKMLKPAIGQIVSYQGEDYEFVGLTRNKQWKLKKGGKLKKLAVSKIVSLIKKMELYIVE